jgi:SAM-dependent methyltransferase
VWPVRTQDDPFLKESFALLRAKWGEVPCGEPRVFSKNLLTLSDAALLNAWREGFEASSSGEAFSVRGWYQLLYKDIFSGKKIIDFGCGLALDTIFYAEHGAEVTFVDLVEENVETVRRLCRLKGLAGHRFRYMEDLRALADLPANYDAVYCCGSLITAPLAAIRLEAQELLKHLVVGGRWIELGYPKSRWEREGCPPFDHWGNHTDGGAPWMEWHDLSKVSGFLAPAVFDTVLELEFHDGDFNWFDLVRRS